MQIKLFSNSRMQISVKKFSFHAGVGHHFEICKNVVDSILKKFGQVVDNLLKGLYVASTSDMCIHYIFARLLGTVYFKL
jgi:hypothetical protein